MQDNDAILRRVIDVLEDGKTFYQDARGETSDVALGQLCTRMVEERDIGVRQLLPYLSEPAVETVVQDEGTWTGTFDRLYAEARSLLGQGSGAFVEGLIDYEQRLLATIDAALADLSAGRARDAVALVRETVLKTQDTIVALRRTQERPKL